MNRRFPLAAFWVFAVAVHSAQAGPTFSINAGPQPGPSSLYPNVDYSGPNQVSGSMNTLSPDGILGKGTPSNSNNVYYELSISFSISNNSGYFDIGSDFTGQVTSSNVTATGGSFDVMGVFSPSVASFFGISSTTELAGVVDIGLAPASQTSFFGNDIGSVEFTFAPSVPEPPSLVMLALGVVGTLGYLRRRWAKDC